MALTLAEGAKLSNDVLLEGVIETVTSDRRQRALHPSLHDSVIRQIRLSRDVTQT